MSTLNILITNLSTVKLDRNTNKPKKENYVDVENNLFTGEMTNEAPIKSVIKRLSDKNQQLNKIIYIESKKVQSNISNDLQISHSDFLRVNIKKYTEENHLHFPIYDKDDTIFIADEPREKDVSKVVFQIYQKIINYNQNENGKINIYIESNGGVRYVQTMLLAVTKTLETSNKNIRIQAIYSMVRGKEPISIIETKQIYDTAQITSIVDEFVNYGRTRSLENYIKEHLDDANSQLKKDIIELLSKFSKMADDIQLCRTGMILDDFYKDGGLKKHIDTFLKKYPDDGETIVLPVFKHILKIVKSQFDVSLYSTNQYTNSNSIVCLPQVIQWCLDKNFIQQALTLSTECLPEYLFEAKKIIPSKEMRQLIDNADTQKYEKYYFFLAHLQNDFLSQFNNALVKRVLLLIQSHESADKLKLNEDDWKDILQKGKLSDVSNVKSTEKLQDIANKVYNMGLDFYNLELNFIRSESSLEGWLKDYGLDKDLIDKRINISKKKHGTFQEILLGKSGSNGNVYIDKNIQKKKDRWKKVMPTIIKEFINHDSDIQFYDSLLESLFSDDKELLNACKNKYSKEQSEKFYIKEAVKAGYITTSMESVDDLQKLLYIYSICKEQRNLSNHAHVNKDDVVMNSEQLRRVINALLKTC